MINLEEYLCEAKIAALTYRKKMRYKYTFDELYSAACIGLIKARDTYRDDKGTCFKTWASRKIRWSVCDYITSDKRFNEKKGAAYGSVIISLNYEDNDLSERIIGAISFEDELLIKVMVDRALESLDERSRKVINLIYYRGLTYKEAGEKLKVSESTVCKIIKTSLSVMKSSIESKKPQGCCRAIQMA
ncbi:RNA polymerase sigma factor FliA [Clostridium puniceum]|uniref:RNA polymerase sigma factor FliA n=1 Tax=Clostridium puniceum TaxID=29367 RepID=A0A1S8TNQ9_9CLOT|nr:sigma-70 family RNA polymerase sigma factor [Clostridium puniceum]OOM79407.1 RNA polymerase sigma factor FliA [Clostridium puniceum]